MEQVAPGMHRIESDLGLRLMAQYLLVGDERSILVDTGLARRPTRPWSLRSRMRAPSPT
jgi:hypothetical protein